MTVVEHAPVEVFAPEVTRPDVRAMLDDIREKPDVNEQLLAFTPASRTVYCNASRFPERLNAEEFDALVEFAADPTSSPSLLVRAQALDLATSSLEERSYKPPLSPEMAQRRKEFEELIPDAFSEFATQSRTYGEITGSWYRYMANQLIRREGIREDIIFPDWHQYSFDPYGMPDGNPVRAFMLLDVLDRKSRAGEELPMNRFSRLIPLALHIQDTIQEKSVTIQEQQAADLQRRGRLSRLIDYGDDHRRQIVDFLQSNQPEVGAYVDVLNDLYDAAQGLGKVFPAQFSESVAKGARELVASSIFAVREHVQNGGHTAAKLPLGNNANALDLKLEGCEPLVLLSRLHASMEALQNVVASPSTIVTPVTKVTRANDYRLYRFYDPAQGKQASLYIRPRGGFAYDSAMEYGRPTEGVEASISFVVDAELPADRLLKVGKSTRRTKEDDRISIRLDREGVHPTDRHKEGVRRDPSQEQGTLSLDVGSVLGNDDWTSTKIGRLLAWGNHLRSQQRGERTGLNHVTHYFNAHHGHADFFAGVAQEAIISTESRRTPLRQVAAICAGPLAARSVRP